MKRLIKLPMRWLWRLTAPVRRPLVRKAEAMLTRCCTPPAVTHVCHVNEETGLLMDHLVRELVRLQSKIDRLQESVEDLAPATTGLAVVSGPDADDLRSAAG